MNSNSKLWLSSNATVFWGEIAPSSHVLQLYENDDAFLSLLECFIEEGIKGADAVIVIGTEAHLKDMNSRLLINGFDVDSLCEDDQYIPLNCEEALSKFMVNGWPDDKLFFDFVNSILSRGQKNGRRIRAFGEMVAVLWEQGNSEATVKLEHLWEEFMKKESFCLYCAYPKSGFTQDAYESLNNICCSHAMMVKQGESKSWVNYKNVDQAMVG